MKRCFDFIFSLIFLVITFPLMILVALMIYLTSGRPILFRHRRAGYQGRPFVILKFRTMRCDVIGQESSDYERVTRVGRLIRKLSLDELPQLMNILKGEMSLVGPRPLLMEYLSLYNERQRKRHHALPGITGWAQVNGRNNISHEQKFELDVWYVENWSFRLDLKILILTFWTVFQGKGVNFSKYATISKFEGETKNK